ncbi:hypothetical protein V8D89_011842 [Ganoderma adspersum]
MPPRKKVKTDHIQEGPTTTPRRTTRASNKAANVVTPDALDVQPPPVTSVAPAVVKLRRGCLKEIPNFAVEIQLMIFGHLHPKDLFNLSRTAKIFHGFFLHRSNEPLWHAALKNAEDLPERPPWMSIPSFIHLLYSTHCHNCGCPNIRSVEWLWFTRYCSKCLSEVKYSSADVSHLLSEASCNIHAVTATFTGTKAGRPTGTSNGMSISSLNNGLLSQSLGIRRPAESFTPNVAMILKFEGSTLSDAGSGTIGCSQRVKKTCGMDARTVSLRKIVKRLMETGWEKDLDFLGPYGLERMSRLPVVRQSGKLTEKGWEKVQTALRKFLNEARDARLKKEREAVIKERFAELDKAIIAHCVITPRDATMDCRPVAFDLALQAELEPIANAPSSESVTQETFAAIVPQLVTKWEAEQRQLFRAFLQQFITTVPPGVDVLDLAIAIFYSLAWSSQKVRRMRYPYLLTFLEFRHCRGGWRFSGSHYADPARPTWSSKPCDPTSLQRKEVEVGIKWMRNIVTGLGLDPDTATFTDLEQCEARLRCLQCAKTKGPEHAYTWEAAFAHTAEHNTTRSNNNVYPRSKHHCWSRVKKADMAKVKEREAVAHTLTADSDCWWSCALCANWKGQGSGGKVREHLASEHNITDANGAVDDGTIFWSPVHNDKLRKPAVQL